MNVNDNGLLTLFRQCKVLRELWRHSEDFSVKFRPIHHHAAAVSVCNVIWSHRKVSGHKSEEPIGIDPIRNII